jgi:hypothetical protein
MSMVFHESNCSGVKNGAHSTSALRAGEPRLNCRSADLLAFTRLLALCSLARSMLVLRTRGAMC